MKQNYLLRLFIATCLLSPVLVKAQYSYMGTFDYNGRPSYLVSPPDTISPAFEARINASLPESYSVPVYNPQYLASAPTDLRITQTSDAWITFISEGATYQNALGYYTYDLNNPPTVAPPDSAVHIIYPNCSFPGLGGNLNPGDKVYLGNFAANTGIGFVLVANGFHFPDVNNPNWVLYSNPAFNPELDPNLRRHNVLLLDTPSNTIVLGFEDIRRDMTICDQDFNDALFDITILPFNHVNTDSMPYTINPGDSSSSGGSGGLESESLCGLASKREFDKMKNSISRTVNYSTLPVYKNDRFTATAKTTGSSRLSALLPSNLENTFTPRITTPADLVEITNASDVLSVDYTTGNIPKAVVLGITTLSRPYSHTKAICDRFRGSTLVSVDSIYIDSMKFSRYLMRKENGELEYSIAFAASTAKDSKSYKLQTNWLLSEYQANDTVYNFQVWATMPHYSVKLVKDILNNLRAAKPVEQITADYALPKAFIINGKREKGNLVMTLSNRTDVTNAELVFEERLNENSNTTTRSVPLTIVKNSSNTYSLTIADGYEYSGSLYLNNELVDEVYFADGNWALDFDKTYTTIKNYNTVNEPTREYADDEYPVYRNLELNASSTDYISVYKSIKAGYESEDLSAYKTLKFFAKGTGDVEIKLLKDGVVNWKNQYRKTVTLVPEGKTYEVGLDQFTSPAFNKEMTTEDINSVVFTFLIPDGNNRDINFNVSDMSFTKKVVFNPAHFQSKSLSIYPNPTTGNFTCSFASDEDRTVYLKVTDVAGRIIYTQQVNANEGMNTVNVNMPADHLPTLMFINLSGNGVKYDTNKLIGK